MVTRILRDDPGKSSMHNVSFVMTSRIDFYGTTDKPSETSFIPELLVGEPFGL